MSLENGFDNRDHKHRNANNMKFTYWLAWLRNYGQINSKYKLFPNLYFIVIILSSLLSTIENDSTPSVCSLNLVCEGFNVLYIDVDLGHTVFKMWA
jgi:hypothetical protein